MALGSEDGSSNGPQQPFAYVLIPILGFGVIVTVLTCYKYKRRKRRLARMVAEDPTLGRDPETGRTRLDRREPNGTVTGRRRAGRRLGLGVGSREEGLNELGEAPPAYTPNAPKPPSETGGIELMTYSQATAEIGTSRSPPGYADESRTGPAIGSTSASAGGPSDSARISQEMRRDVPTGTTASGAGETMRLSEEMRRGNLGNTPASGAGDTARVNEETRTDTPENATAVGSASETVGFREDARRNPPLTTSGASEPTRSSEGIDGGATARSTGTSNDNVNEMTTASEGGITENTTGTTTTAMNATTTTPSTTDEPAPPPKAVLPPSSG
ncbi:hypothetical protein F5B22DRAFT_514079 [Xylaria bambusicola]|uniref:uncharacterized protein n=1 Tax=Xylaria bambusicola TaxID=326684 RepID=UPI0020089CCB|nr:uncharacterized protein F5B22DRAFT_514079 [Xylaria bambusicola]KAI0522025.1 hypothetical protein F5B22DRAFT_514079 [Xylaria bambusicola]